MTAESKEINFRDLVMSRNEVTWAALKKIDWENVPVTGSDEHVTYSRHVAGMVRDYEEFYTRAERDYAMSVERWLMRYSAEHTHPSLRS